MRKRLNIPADAFCLLYLGRLDPMKRPLETVDAVAEAGDERVHLICVGNESGVTVSEVEARARQKGVAGRVHVVGPQYGDAKHGFVDAADCYISLSHRENFNFTAAESLACGLPVILSEGNDLAHDLTTVDCGWMLGKDDCAASVIAKAVSAGSTDLGRRGTCGRAWATDNLQFAPFRERLRAFTARVAATHR